MLENSAHIIAFPGYNPEVYCTEKDNQDAMSKIQSLLPIYLSCSISIPRVDPEMPADVWTFPAHPPFNFVVPSLAQSPFLHKIGY